MKEYILSSSLFTCCFHKSKNMPYITYSWFFELSLVGFLIKHLWNDFEWFPLLIHSYHLLTLNKIFFFLNLWLSLRFPGFWKQMLMFVFREKSRLISTSRNSLSADWGLLSGSDATSLRPVALWLYTQAEGSVKLPSWKAATQRIKGQDLFAAETVGSLALIQNAKFNSELSFDTWYWYFSWYLKEKIWRRSQLGTEV